MKPDYLKLAEEFNGSNNDFNHAGLKEGYALGVRQFAEFLQSQEAEKGEEYGKCELVMDHTPVWAGDCYMCSQPGCGAKFDIRPEVKGSTAPSPLQGLKEIEKLPYSFKVIDTDCSPTREYEARTTIPQVIDKINALIENQNKIVSILKQRE